MAVLNCCDFLQYCIVTYFCNQIKNTNLQNKLEMKEKIPFMWCVIFLNRHKDFTRFGETHSADLIKLVWMTKKQRSCRFVCCFLGFPHSSSDGSFPASVSDVTNVTVSTAKLFSVILVVLFLKLVLRYRWDTDIYPHHWPTSVMSTGTDVCQTGTLWSFGCLFIRLYQPVQLISLSLIQTWFSKLDVWLL